MGMGALSRAFCTAWGHALLHRQALKGWQLALIAVALFTRPLAAEIMTTNTVKLLTIAESAVCGELYLPQPQPRIYINLGGHEFDVHNADIARYDGKTIAVAGNISHKLSFLRRDDQIDYTIPFKDGKPDTAKVTIRRGGFGVYLDIFAKTLQFLGANKIKLKDVEFELKPEKLPEIASVIGTTFEGGWESRATGIITRLGKLLPSERRTVKIRSRAFIRR